MLQLLRLFPITMLAVGYMASVWLSTTQPPHTCLGRCEGFSYALDNLLGRVGLSTLLLQWTLWRMSPMTEANTYLVQNTVFELCQNEFQTVATRLPETYLIMDDFGSLLLLSGWV